MRAFAALSLLLICLNPPTAEATAADFPHVRSDDAALRSLLDEGYKRSPTFRTIVDRLERSDVIVHVERYRTADRTTAGALHFGAAAGGYRYVRIRVVMPRSPRSLVALLAHELQHALEIAEDPSVVDLESFRALYRRIGHPCRQSSTGVKYDTAAARSVERVVAEELRRAARHLPRIAAARPRDRSVAR